MVITGFIVRLLARVAQDVIGVQLRRMQGEAGGSVARPPKDQTAARAGVG
jgi:hypothetical protein